MSIAKLALDIVQSINPRARRRTRLERDLREADANGKLRAIDRAMAVIEFQLDGTVIAANDNFLRTMGYAPEEILGKHHSLFVDEAMRASAEYQRQAGSAPTRPPTSAASRGARPVAARCAGASLASKFSRIRGLTSPTTTSFRSR